jgi:hypothetical protein
VKASTQRKQRVRKSELAAVRIERPLLTAVQLAAMRLEITMAEFMRRALLRECERVGALPTIY